MKRFIALLALLLCSSVADAGYWGYFDPGGEDDLIPLTTEMLEHVWALEEDGEHPADHGYVWVMEWEGDYYMPWFPPPRITPPPFDDYHYTWVTESGFLMTSLDWAVIQSLNASGEDPDNYGYDLIDLPIESIQ